MDNDSLDRVRIARSLAEVRRDVLLRRLDTEEARWWPNAARVAELYRDIAAEEMIIAELADIPGSRPEGFELAAGYRVPS